MNRPVLFLAHPSPDLYGADRQLLVTIEALVDAGWAVTVCLPHDGPLVPLIEQRGARAVMTPFPVVRKALASPTGLSRFSWQTITGAVRLARQIKASGARGVLVNTLTLPVWLLAARLARVPVVCHVHEAEEDPPMLVRRALVTPLLLANGILVNSGATRRALVDACSRLSRRMTVIHNGVSGPPNAQRPLRQRISDEPARLALIARLSPRKGIDVALEAMALLRAQRRDVRLEICGSVFPGYEWCQEQFSERAARSDLAGSISFRGYVDPIWPILERADVVLVPSRTESFGNAAVEGMLSGRPVVASAVQGLTEVIDHGRTGMLVGPDDPAALAHEVALLLDNPALAHRLAAAGQAYAEQHFSPARYAEQILSALASYGLSVPSAKGVSG